jgi:hypothetical protein
MASGAGRKPANARLEEGRIKARVRRSNGAIVYAVAALLLLGVGYLVFNGIFPTVSETVPSPDINSTVAPPPADAPAANP